MAEWLIRPHEGAGPIDFDMTPSRVTEILGPPPFPRQTSTAGNFTWLYNHLNIVIGFDPDLRCDFVGFLSGTVGVVDNIRLIGSHEQLVREFRHRGYDIVEPPLLTRFAGPVWSGETVCPQLGVAIRRETEDQELISDAAAFRPGFWEAERVAAENRINSLREAKP